MTSELKSMIGENYAEQSSIPNQNHQKELQRKTKDYIKRQTGLKRELIKLIGGVPSIVERSNHKVAKRSNWVWSKFSNPSRKDKLELEHWQRKESYEQEELNKILDNNILCINPKNQNQSPIPNKSKRMSAFQETPHLNSLVQNINNDIINNNKLINTYKSKIRTKFLKIYDTNSINIQGKIKYKLFHKCCYPGCNRTFSSSGWLKAHFKEHLKQIHNSRFSLLFKKYIYNQQMNKINNKNNNCNHEKNGNNKENKIVKKTFFIIDKESK